MKRIGRNFLVFAVLTTLPVVLGSCAEDDYVPFDPFATEIPFNGGNPFTPPTPPGPSGGGGGGGGGGGTTAPTPPGTTTDRSVVPKIPAPIGLTFHIGMAENVSQAVLQQVYAQFASVNTVLWNLSEGQIYLYKLVISDAVAPGTTPAGWEANNSLFNSSNLDVVIWPASAWNISPAGVVWWISDNSFGRYGRLMLLPDDASGATRIHEVSHLIWTLSWANSFGLDDEYVDGVQDPACLMESNNSPVRYCSAGNHVNQSSQPHSCWTQILNDFTLLSHGGKDTASTPAWVPIVEYTDTP